MSSSSKAKQVNVKFGNIRELKLVHSISRNGADTLKTEEVKTPRHGSRNEAFTSRHSSYSSPNKRPRMETFEGEPIPWDLEEKDLPKKRQTLVFPRPRWSTLFI